MRKLRLDPEALLVETFVPEHGRGGPGTVHGYISYPDGCFPPSGTEPEWESCGYHTCAGDTCYQSCNGYTCDCAGGGSVGCQTNGYTCAVECRPPTREPACPA